MEPGHPGIALGLVYAPMSTAAMAAMPREKSGIVSGVLAMNRVLAGAVALAVTGAVFQDLLSAHGFPVALARSNWVLVGLITVCTVLTWLFVRSAPSSRTDAALPASADPGTERHHQHHRRFHGECDRTVVHDRHGYDLFTRRKRYG